MASFPVQILLGLYLGVLTGILPALASWALGFTVRYFTGVSVPGFGVVALAFALAGVNSGILVLSDSTVLESDNSVALIVAVVVVLMLAMYAHARGDALGAELPRRLSLRRLAERTLSTDVVDLVGERGRVELRIVGDVGDIPGYPALPAPLRASIREETLAFPADLPLSELETRAADRLRNEYDLADVSVTVDERGHATVRAAPPVGVLSRRVPAGRRAVSVEALAPAGLDRGDEVIVAAAGDDYRGTVLSVAADPGAAGGRPTAGDPVADGGERAGRSAAEPGGPSGTSRVTLAAAPGAARALLAEEVERLVALPRRDRGAFEGIALLRRGGARLRRLTVREGGALDGVRLGDAAVRETHGVAVLAVRAGERWAVAPDGSVALAPGDELFAAGSREALDAFAEAVA